MAETVGQHSVAAFTSPVNGTTPIDANTVRGNDNTVRSAYVDHDADPGIHVQSSSLASRPVAGTVGRKWITEDSGVYTLWFDDGTNWHPVSSENVALTVLAGENLVKGDVVKVTGWNNGQDLPEVVKTTSASDTAFAVITATVSSGSMGYATNTGIVQDVNTAAYSVGTILYANGSGGFTSTKPTSGNYQPVAYVMRSNTNNGVYYVEFSTPRIVERSDNTASTIVLRDASGNFSAGTITAGALTSTGLVTFASLKGTGATTVTNILDEDNMASDSATALATQQSIKAYVDAKVATVDTLAEVLANGNTTGANNIIVSSGQKITTNTIDETTAAAGVTIDSVLLKDNEVKATGLLVTNLKANDGTAAGSIANSTGVVTLASSVLTTTDINGGTIDGTTIGGASAAAGTFTTVAATTGNITTVNATTVDTTNIEVTNIKAKDGTASIAIADSTGVATITAAPVLSALTASQAVFTDASKGLVSNAITGTGNVVMSASPTLTGTVTAATINATTLGGTLSTAAQPNVTSVGTLTSLTVSGDLTVDTNTLSVNATSNRVGIGTTSAVWNSAEKLVVSQSVDAPVITGYSTFGAGTPVLVSWNSATSGTREHIWFADSASGGVRGKIATNGANGLQFLYGSTVGMSLDSSGNFIVDTNTLYVDAANNRVGVGTASPDVTLDVEAAVGTSTALVMLKNTSGASASNIAQMQFWSGNTFGGLEQIASIHGINPNAASNNGGTLVFSTSSNGTATTPTERMRLDASGRLGLGMTPTGSYSLQLYGVGTSAGSARIRLQNSATGSADADGGGMAMEGTDMVLQNTESGVIKFEMGASNTTRMTLDASGNLLVGGTSAVFGAAGRGTIEANGSSSAALGLTVGATATGLLFHDGTNSYYRNYKNGYFAIWTNDTERARIDASGNLGVGVTPSAWASTGRAVQVGSSRSSSLMALDVGGTYYTILGHNWYYDGANDKYISTDVASRILQHEGIIRFQNAASGTAGNNISFTERARITSGGDFLVNTTTANGKITVAVPDGTTNAFYAERTGASPATLDLDFANQYTNWNSSVRYQIVAGGSGGVYLDVGATSWAAVSDERLKTTLTPFENAVQKVCAIRTGTGRYLTDSEDVSRAFMIAQDVQAVLPEAVSVENDDQQTLGLRYTETIPLLVAAIKELTARLEALEA